MDNLLNKQTVPLSRYIMDCHEECAVSGEFILPDYCRDIAEVLKCMLTPRIQNRQWSGDRLLVDAVVNVRVLYLDEDRCAPHAVEFSLPVSCALPGNGTGQMGPVCLEITPKYANCRALGPRKLEVRGAVVVKAKAEAREDEEICVASTETGLHTRHKSLNNTYPIGSVEKILTLHESFDFPDSMPPAEMLLGGDCSAVIKECKLLAGKGIVKGQVYVHQLYAVDIDTGECRCLDYALPFSQILDMEGMDDGMPYCVDVQIVSDTERCIAGQDGENTVLDVTVKLLVYLQVFCRDEMTVVLDAYHTSYPITPVMTEMHVNNYLGCRSESAVLPMKVPLLAGRLSQVLEVWIESQGCDTVCRQEIASIKGRWLVCVLAKDMAGQVVYFEHPEEYCLELACKGNLAEASVCVADLHYRIVEDQMELQVGVCVHLSERWVEDLHTISDLKLHQDAPYAKEKIGLLVYYAQPGECVWDIGSRCHTSPECICEENRLNEEVIQHPSVLLVPIVS